MFALYEFQSKVIGDLREGFRQGHKRQVLAIATGGGKTVVAGHLALSAASKGTRALFIVDRIELVGQAVRTFHALGLRVGILRGEDTCYREADDIVVASIQTIAKRRAPDWVRLILIDECHILHREHVKLMDAWNAIPVIGLSATPLRKGLGKHFTNLVRGPSVRELTEQGFLVPVCAFAPGAEHIAELLTLVANSLARQRGRLQGGKPGTTRRSQGCSGHPFADAYQVHGDGRDDMLQTGLG